jgi:hypothetical protein
MLGRFIVSAGRLQEFEDAAAALLPRDAGSEPWQISLLGGDDPADDAERVWAFNERHAHRAVGRAVIDTMELKGPDAAAAERAVRSIPAGVTAYVEIPIAEDPGDLIGVLRGVGARAKVRTGGITREAFPPPSALARFIRSCGDAGVPFKATAGLHHPLRGDYRLTYEAASGAGTMYGFLNVLLAVEALTEGATSGVAEDWLQETDSRVLGRAVGLWSQADAARTRAAFISFGTCSVLEPVEDLVSLGLLSPTERISA